MLLIFLFHSSGNKLFSFYKATKHFFCATWDPLHPGTKIKTFFTAEDFLSYDHSNATGKKELKCIRKSLRKFSSSFSRGTTLSIIWSCSRAIRTNRKKREHNISHDDLFTFADSVVPQRFSIKSIQSPSPQNHSLDSQFT